MQRTRQGGSILLLAFMLAFMVAGPVAAEGGLPATLEPNLPQARAVLLMDGSTGQVLYGENEHEQRSIASITKVMTAWLALERGTLDDLVTISARAARTGGTSMYLAEGERVTLDGLLHGLMLVSGNDAAVAIAEHLAGSMEAFVGWMNERAAAVGATQTRFANSHGFDNANHYSTAYDMALITRQAMRNQAFRNLVATRRREVPGVGGGASRSLVNRNVLLGTLEGATGVKAGWTRRAQRTYVAAARRGETELIAVVLGTEYEQWEPARALLEFGFAHFDRHLVGEAGLQVGTAPGGIPAVLADGIPVILPKGFAPSDLTRRFVWESHLTPPLEVGDRVGHVELLLGEKVLQSAALVTPVPVPAATTRPVHRPAAAVSARPATLAARPQAVRWLPAMAAIVLLSLRASLLVRPR